MCARAFVCRRHKCLSADNSHVFFVETLYIFPQFIFPVTLTTNLKNVKSKNELNFCLLRTKEMYSKNYGDEGLTIENLDIIKGCYF
jgi:hypothetical protein